MTSEPTGDALSAEQLLEHSRPLTLQVGPDGTVIAAHGGFGGFLGFDVAHIAGTNVFDFVAESESHHLATYFIESAGESPYAIALPIPFRITVVAPDGLHHAVDIIPTGMHRVGGQTQWVAVLVPVSLYGSVTRSLDLEMEGGDRAAVKRMLCEELVVDNASYTSRWILVEFGDDGRVDVCTSREEDAGIAEAIRRDVIAGWTPWAGLERSAVAIVDPSSIGDATRTAMAERTFQRSIVAPVHARNRLVAAYVLVGRVPDDYVESAITANVVARIEKLVRGTELLIGRWTAEDQLRLDAARDPLTGLHNARALRTELERASESGAMLFVDVDRFKPVNDTFGHVMGDVVLRVVAERLLLASGTGSLVARVGGDEFVIVLAGADGERATAVGNAIIEAVGRPLGLVDGPDAITISVGLAMLDASNPFEAADQAMLSAKRSGRDRLSIAPVD